MYTPVVNYHTLIHTVMLHQRISVPFSHLLILLTTQSNHAKQVPTSKREQNETMYKNMALLGIKHSGSN